MDPKHWGAARKTLSYKKAASKMLVKSTPCRCKRSRRPRTCPSPRTWSFRAIARQKGWWSRVVWGHNLNICQTPIFMANVGKKASIFCIDTKRIFYFWNGLALWNSCQDKDLVKLTPGGKWQAFKVLLDGVVVESSAKVWQVTESICNAWSLTLFKRQ